MIAQVIFGIPTIVIGFRIVMLEFNGPIIIRYGATMIAHLRVGIPPIVVGSHKIRLKFNSPIIVRYGITIATQA